MLILYQLLHVLHPLHIIFIHFFGTNLLTRCRSASSCFLLFLYSRKASLEIFSKLDENLRRPQFYQKTPGVRRGDEVEPRGPHTRARRGQGSAGAQGWCRHLVHRLAIPFGLYIAPTPKTLKESTISPEKFQSSAAIQNPNSGDRSLCLAPCRDGKLPPEPSPSTPPPPSSLLLPPMMRRE